MELNPQAGRKLCSTDLGSFPCEVVLGLGSCSARCQHRAPFGAPSHAGVCTPKRSPGARGCRLGRAGGSVSATQTLPQARSCHGACGHAAAQPRSLRSKWLSLAPGSPCVFPLALAGLPLGSSMPFPGLVFKIWPAQALAWVFPGTSLTQAMDE